LGLTLDAIFDLRDNLADFVDVAGQHVSRKLVEDRCGCRMKSLD
jgi:hypothetical protein